MRRLYFPSATRAILAVMQDARTKTVEELRGVELADIACGKNHSVAVERAPGTRVFTWGFGG